MKIDILTLFPDMFIGPFNESIIKRAKDKNIIELNIHNLRDWSTDAYRTVDDHPYGGGAGMIMKVDVVDRAVQDLKTRGTKSETRSLKVVLLDTKGTLFTQVKAKTLSSIDHLIFIAGHYEGLDHRIHEHIADEVISIGPYVLTGGELPAMVVVDSVVRLIPEVINPDSLAEESYSDLSEADLKNIDTWSTSSGTLEYPQYTRPAEYKGWKVPEILLNGNHKEIEKWRKGK